MLLIVAADNTTQGPDNQEGVAGEYYCFHAMQGFPSNKLAKFETLSKQ